MQLQDLLRARMLPISGKKAVLINRLIQSMNNEHGITKNCHVILNRVSLSEYMRDIEHEEGRGCDEKNNVMPSTTRQKLIDNQEDKMMNSKKENKTRNPTKPKMADEKNTTSGESTSFMTLRSKLKAHQKHNKVEGQSDGSNATSKEKPNTRSKFEHKSNEGANVVSKEEDEPPNKKVRKTIPVDGKSSKRKQQKQLKIVPATAMMLKPLLQKFEMVWAHVKGFKNWPGIIEEETSNGRYRIHFFGDYSTSTVTKNKIMHVLEGFRNYESVEKPTLLLIKAITEAQMFVLDQSLTECPICKMEKIKDILMKKQNQ